MVPDTVGNQEVPLSCLMDIPHIPSVQRSHPCLFAKSASTAPIFLALENHLNILGSIFGMESQCCIMFIVTTSIL